MRDVHPLPARADRVASARRLIGPRDPAVAPLIDGLRAHTARCYDRWVLPIVRGAWPALEHEPFGLKLRLAVCHLYAAAPYTVLLCAPGRPPVYRLISAVGGAAPLSPRALARGGQAALWVLSRLPHHQAMHRRVVLIAAFIAVADHVFDHCLGDTPPVARGELMRAIIDGRGRPTSPALRLTDALRRAMAARLAPHERAPFAEAMRSLHRWVDAEVAGELGAPDPAGLGHRQAGIAGTIDGLLVPVHRHAGPQARAWMVGVSLFVQILDDWIDAESDRAGGRGTPVLAGRWGLAELRRAWHDTLAGLDAMAASSGLAPRYADTIRRAYVTMMRDVVDGMGDGRAD